MIAVADTLRRALLVRVAPGVRTVVIHRDLRIATTASVGIATSLTLALFFPAWLLALSPIVWGTPHLLADVRYLVARTGLHRRAGFWLAIAPPIVVAAVSGLGVRAGLLAALGAVGIARTTTLRRVVTALVVVACIALAWGDGRIADLVLAHAHNYVAVALWWTWRARRPWFHTVPLALFVAASAALLGGLGDGIVQWTHGWLAPASGLMPGGILLALAPFPEHLAMAYRLAMLFAFSQSVHYLVWLRIIPDEARSSPTAHSFRQSWRAVVRDLGRWIPLAAIALTLAFALWSVFDLVSARDGYLRFALFHGHLEIAIATLFWLERTRP